MAAFSLQPRSSRTWRLVVALSLCCSFAVAPVRAQAPVGEADAKVRFTLAMARFVQWPASAAAGRPTLRLCLIQRSPALAAAFASHQGIPVTGRALEVLGSEAARTGSCDLLFIDASAGSSVADALAAVAGRPVLTLGTVDGFIARGGMVELVNVDDALRFDVDLKPLRAVSLGLSAQVLRLARRVQD